MKQIICSEVYVDFKSLTVYEQREYALNGRLTEFFVEVSDLDGKGWYCREVRVVPRLTVTGKFYFQKKVQNSCTYKNGKFYGSPAAFLLHYLCRLYKFNWVQPILREEFGNICTKIPDYAIGMILDGKITNPEDLWKTIAKRSYHESHWKIVKFCRNNHISMIQLKLGCRDWEAIRDIEDLPCVFSRVLKQAIVMGEKISCKWSDSRLQNEELRMIRQMDELKLQGVPDEHAWIESGFTYKDFALIDSERLAMRTSNHFQNCVRTNYWKLIQKHQYICFASEDICIGYQVLPDGDVMFDQCRGKYNCSVVNQAEIDAMIRPIAQQIVEQHKLLTK